MTDADRVLRRIADRQRNLVTRKQALDADVSEKELRTRVRRGTLRRIHRGVFFFGAGALTFEQRALAACLACGDDAYVSGPSAAALWGIATPHDGPIHITMPSTGGKGPVGVDVRHSSVSGPTEQTVRDRVPISRVNRTLLDLSGVLSFDDLQRAADSAFRARLTTPHDLYAYLEGRNGPGIAELRRIARDRIDFGVHDTDFEAATEAVLIAHGLPRPQRQVWFRSNGRRYRFDLAYEDERVAIEPNGQAPHWGKERWQSDHDKRIAAKQVGVNMLEFTWDDVHERQLYVVLTAGDALGLRPSRWVRKDRPSDRNGRA